MTMSSMSRIFVSLGLSFALWGCVEPPKTLEPEDGYPADIPDLRKLVPEITDLRVDPTLSGVIVRVTGLTAGPGYWDVELVYPLGVDERTRTGEDLILELRAAAPDEEADLPDTGPQEIVAARFILTKTLEGVRTITVVAGTNRLTVSR